MKGHPIRYSREELAWIEARRTMPRSELHVAFCEQFGRNDVTADALKQLCLRRGWTTGRDGRLRPGNVPVNKGKKMPFNPNSARTQFKKGQLPHNTKYLGHERLSKDGYVEISVAQTNPYTGFGRRYVLKHRWLWEQANGPVPAGHALKCLDGERTNTDPSNWIAVPRAAMPRLAGRWHLAYDSASPEIRPTILALALLQHGAKQAKARQSEAGRTAP